MPEGAEIVADSLDTVLPGRVVNGPLTDDGPDPRSGVMIDGADGDTLADPIGTLISWNKPHALDDCARAVDYIESQRSRVVRKLDGECDTPPEIRTDDRYLGVTSDLVDDADGDGVTSDQSPRDPPSEGKHRQPLSIAQMAKRVIGKHEQPGTRGQIGPPELPPSALADEDIGHGQTIRAARVVLKIVEGNAASAAVARRAGFVYEGTLRSHGVWQGERCDVMLFAALAIEWTPSVPMKVRGTRGPPSPDR